MTEKSYLLTETERRSISSVIVSYGKLLDWAEKIVDAFKDEPAHRDWCQLQNEHIRAHRERWYLAREAGLREAPPTEPADPIELPALDEPWSPKP